MAYKVIGPDEENLKEKVLEYSHHKLFSYTSIYTCVLSAQKNRLNETVLLSTYNMFWSELSLLGF